MSAAPLKLASGGFSADIGIVPVQIEIPDSVVQAIRLPPQELESELRKELAVALYSRGALSTGKAAEFAGLSRAEFDRFLAVRKIARNYSRDDLRHDLQWAEKQDKKS